MDNIIANIDTDIDTSNNTIANTDSDISNNTIANTDIDTIANTDIDTIANTDIDTSNNTIANTDIDTSNNTIANTDISSNLKNSINANTDISNNTIANTDTDISNNTIANTDILNNTIANTDISNNTIANTDISNNTIANIDTDISNNTNANTDISSNLQNSTNVFDPNVKNIYRPKYTWGPVIWNYIHTISIIDFVDNEMYVNEIKKYLQLILNILPCKHCCNTYKIWIDKLDTIDTNERMVLFKWSVDLHNDVNIKLNKQTWSYEQAVERWCNKLPELPLL